MFVIRELTVRVSQVSPHQSPVSCPPVQGVDPVLAPWEQCQERLGGPHHPPESGPDSLTEVFWLSCRTGAQHSQQIVIRFPGPALQVCRHRVGERFDDEGLVSSVVNPH